MPDLKIGKYKTFLLTMVFSTSLSQVTAGQQINSVQQKVEQLQYVKKMPYLPDLSGDSIFWAVVMEKLDAVPSLIEQLNDTTLTDATVPNFGGTYTVADISYEVISKIIKNIPTMDFVVKSDNPTGGYWYYWDYVRGGYENRVVFKDKVQQWYNKEKSNLTWKEDNRTYRTAPDWKFDSNKNPAGGFYELSN